MSKHTCPTCTCDCFKGDACNVCNNCDDYGHAEDDEPEPDDPYDFDDDFADPGGNSALRAATEDNPRDLPCPTCKAENRLTPADRAQGYQCDSCADRAERGWGY